jgi:RHS repeat-associated protein
LAICYTSSGQENGSQYIRKLDTWTTLPVASGSITKKITYAYDSPQTGNVTSVQEWAFRSGTQSSAVFPALPDRATYTKYATIGTNNNINRPTAVTVCNNSAGSDSNCPGGGITTARTTIAYDTYGASNVLPLKDVPSAIQHDDTNFGTGLTARGNPTQISQLVSGSTYLTTYLSYDTTGEVIQVFDSNLNKTTYSYTDNFYYDNGSNPPPKYAPSSTNAYVTSVTDPIGITSMGYYYGSGKLAFGTDYNSVTTYSHYMDPFLLDRLTETILPIGWTLNTYASETQSDSYSAVGDTSPSTGCVSCTHLRALLDSLGRPVTGNLVNNPAGEVTVTSNYDGLNRAVSGSHPYIGAHDPNDVSETQYYDGLGRVLQIRHPDGEGVRSEYGASVSNLGGLTTQLSSTTTYGVGYPIVSVDEAGKQRQEWIDGFGRVIEVDEPASTIATIATATVTVSGSPGGTSGTISITVDGFAAKTSWCSSSTAASLAASLVTALSTPGSPVTAAANGATVTMAAVGYSPSFTVVSSNSSDFTATPTSGTLAGGTGGILSSSVFTAYKYDVLGDLTGVTQGSQTRSYSYDGLSRLIQEVTPEGGTITLSYGSPGALCSGDPSNPCTKTAPAPNQASGTVTTAYTYYPSNLLKTKSNSTGTETYTYGTSAAAFNIGRLVSMTDPSGSEAYSYDAMGDVTKLVKTIGSTAYTTSYSYNAGGQLTGITYPSGRTVQYSYDNVGHLCVIAAATTTCSSSTTPYLTLPSGSYDAAGRPLTATYGNGIVATASYSALRSQLTSIRYSNSSGPLFGLIYYYLKNGTTCPSGSSVGNNGQIQCIFDFVQPGRSSSYTYDPLGRLSTAKTSGSTLYVAWGLSFAFDRYGNRTAQNVTAGSGYSSQLTFNPANNQITSPAFTYDGAGNVLSQSSPSNANYVYDDNECNTSYSGLGGTAAYTCDGNHLRVQKVVTGGATTVYVRSGGQVIAEYDNAAPVTAPNREYIYGNHLLAIITGSSGGSGGTIVYQHRDHLSPRIYTDVNGNCIGDQGTYPYGESWYTNNDPLCGGTATSSWIFTTYERDAESGLQNGNDYALARSYATGNGHFLSPDPLEGDPSDPQSWNRYAYVQNDPINLTDPSGQGFWDDLVNLFLDIGSILSGGQSASDLTNALGCDSGPDCGGTQFDLIYGGAQLAPEFGGGLSAGGAPGSGGGWGVFQGWGGAIGRFAGQGLQTFNTVLYLGVTGIYDTVFAGPLNVLKSASDNICGSDGGACAMVPGVGVEVAVTQQIEEASSVYTIVKDGETVYVGITNNLARRAAEHGEELVEIARGLTRIQARGVEQALIEQHGLAKNGGTLLNKINSIAQSNPKYSNAVQFGKQLLVSIGYAP